jgi:hypothetical protein
MHGYRPPSTEPRGKWAIALHAKRKAEGISQTEGFELLGPRLGFSPKSRAAYIAIDMGTRQPSESEAVVLADWLGYWPDDSSMASSGGATTQPELAAYLEANTAALREQTAAFLTLAASIDRMANGVTGAVGGFAEVLGPVAARLGVELPRTDDGPPSPRPAQPRGRS